MNVPQGMYSVTMPNKLKNWYTMMKKSIESEPWPSKKWREMDGNKINEDDKNDKKENGLSLVDDDEDLENKRLNDEGRTGLDVLIK